MSQLIEAVKKANTIAIGGHIRPDGDCVGSCMGLYGYIKENYPDKAVCVYLEEIAEQFSYLRQEQAFCKQPSYDLFVALDYDIEYAIQDMRENGLYETAPYWARVTECILRGKKTTLGRVLRRAMELCEQETGRCDWPAVPESCWKRAYEEMM